MNFYIWCAAYCLYIHPNSSRVRALHENGGVSGSSPGLDYKKAFVPALPFKIYFGVQGVTVLFTGMYVNFTKCSVILLNSAFHSDNLSQAKE